jgi:hypothetical protein
MQAKNLGVAPGVGDEADSVTSFLLKAMDAPHPLSIKNAIGLLQAINCMDEREQVTSIGHVVSQLPLNPRIGRMILIGCLLGCGPAMLSCAGAMGYRDPFIMPATEQQRVQSNKMKAKLAGGLQVASDQLVVLSALQGFTTSLKRAGMGQARRFCDEYFLSYTTMLYLDELVGQLHQIMKGANVQATHARTQRNDGNHALVQAVIGTGLYPDVGVRRKGTKLFATEKACRTKIHPSSFVSRLPTYRKECMKAVEVIGYQNLIAATQSTAPGAIMQNFIGGAGLMMLGTSPVSVFSILLTCGSIEEISTGADNDDLHGDSYVEVEVDGWFSLQLQQEHLQHVYHARALLTVALSQYLQNSTRALDNAVSTGVDKLVEVLCLEQHACI